MISVKALRSFTKINVLVYNVYSWCTTYPLDAGQRERLESFGVCVCVSLVAKYILVRPKFGAATKLAVPDVHSAG